MKKIFFILAAVLVVGAVAFFAFCCKDCSKECDKPQPQKTVACTACKTCDKAPPVPKQVNAPVAQLISKETSHKTISVIPGHIFIAKATVPTGYSLDKPKDTDEFICLATFSYAKLIGATQIGFICQVKNPCNAKSFLLQVNGKNFNGKKITYGVRIQTQDSPDQTKIPFGEMFLKKEAQLNAKEGEFFLTRLAIKKGHKFSDKPEKSGYSKFFTSFKYKVGKLNYLGYFNKVKDKAPVRSFMFKVKGKNKLNKPVTSVMQVQVTPAAKKRGGKEEMSSAQKTHLYIKTASVKRLPGNKIKITVNGYAPTPGYKDIQFESFQYLVPPEEWEFAITGIPPAGMIIQMISPFTLSLEFTFSDPTEKVTIYGKNKTVSFSKKE
mgnify:CR=1 FL=1